ncbi:MAG: hypothetical protein C0456_08950 [Hyphomonas sp.]|nr:hypothetical protein [Hyphomonas sp.]
MPPQARRTDAGRALDFLWRSAIQAENPDQEAARMTGAELNGRKTISSTDPASRLPMLLTHA